jgi:hypothetical protein
MIYSSVAIVSLVVAILTAADGKRVIPKFHQGKKCILVEVLQILKRMMH